jgi:hypothetical protein
MGSERRILVNEEGNPVKDKPLSARIYVTVTAFGSGLPIATLSREMRVPPVFFKGMTILLSGETDVAVDLHHVIYDTYGSGNYELYCCLPGDQTMIQQLESCGLETSEHVSVCHHH